MPSMFIFGLGYSAKALAARLHGDGWEVNGTSRRGGNGALRFDDAGGVRAGLAGASHILSSVPPSANGDDPVLATYGGEVKAAPVRWIGYISSTGVYGDTGGAWVDESASVGQGRRSARAAADLAWQGLREDVRVFRLPGIYGPGRSALDRVREGRAHLVDAPDQVFSRIHVEDVVAGLIASFTAQPGVYNLADDAPCAQNEVIARACALLGALLPVKATLADLSPQARAFYAENRRIANRKAKRLLGWQPLYPDYKAGLAACLR